MKRADQDVRRDHPPFAPGVIEGPERGPIHWTQFIVGVVGLLGCALVFTGIAAALGWLLYWVLA